MKIETKSDAYKVWEIFDSNGNKIGNYHKGHRAYNEVTGKYTVTASHYH